MSQFIKKHAIYKLINLYRRRRKLLQAGWASSNVALVGIELTYLLKPGLAITYPAHPSPTSLSKIFIRPDFYG